MVPAGLIRRTQAANQSSCCRRSWRKVQGCWGRAQQSWYLNRHHIDSAHMRRVWDALVTAADSISDKTRSQRIHCVQRRHGAPWIPPVCRQCCSKGRTSFGTDCEVRNLRPPLQSILMLLSVWMMATLERANGHQDYRFRRKKQPS